MLEYMSVREAAEKWSVSERRVHKLCKDGRINGIIRFGRSWGIPDGAEKPDDARKANGKSLAVNHADNSAMACLLGPDAKLLVQSDTCAVFQLENETGNGIITVYDVFSGVQLIYNDLHLSSITEHDSIPFAPDAEILTIDHCREGRFECEFPWGECGYLGDGDLVVSELPTSAKASSFPLTHYHGISIMIDVPQAEETTRRVSSLLGITEVDIREIKKRLLTGRPYYLMRSSDAVSHIFSELYNAPDDLKESYIRLKLLELLLFLSVVEPGEENGRQYFYKTRVSAVKAIRDYMIMHLNRQFTLGELSERFDLPLTSMKSCFKSVFGAPIHAYMREYRMQTAASLLRETDEVIAEIAAKVGYDAHTQFSVTVKSGMGMTPSDYRKVSVQNK
ncbi:MAG: helix-turn-helix domain-containing protein [Coriobacteriales bacterium]|jgi:AraC-like DNA-binding protein|nr:helix-turn-helix domain-containing protein [Coriobacteriales bacterium]